MSEQQQAPKKTHAYDLYSDAEWKAVQARSMSFSEQAKAMMREDPGIPVFLGLTCFALCAGLRQSFIKNDPSKANQYMALRVGAQAAAGLAVGWSLLKIGMKDEERMNQLNAKLKEQKSKEQQKDAL